MNALDVLRKTDELLSQPKDWQKDDYGVRGGPCCLTGALRLGAGAPSPDIPPHVLAYYEAAQLLRNEIAGGSIPDYNDSPHRVFEDIKRIIKSAIQRLEKSSS